MRFLPTPGTLCRIVGACSVFDEAVTIRQVNRIGRLYRGCTVISISVHENQNYVFCVGSVSGRVILGWVFHNAVIEIPTGESP